MVFIQYHSNNITWLTSHVHENEGHDHKNLKLLITYLNGTYKILLHQITRHTENNMVLLIKTLCSISSSSKQYFLKNFSPSIRLSTMYRDFTCHLLNSVHYLMDGKKIPGLWTVYKDAPGLDWNDAVRVLRGKKTQTFQNTFNASKTGLDRKCYDPSQFS